MQQYPNRSSNQSVMSIQDEASTRRGGTLSKASSGLQSSSPASISARKHTVDDWSDSLQSILEKPPASLPQRMILGGLLFTVIVGAWSWFGFVKEVSHAQGQLEPLGDVYKVQSSITGPVVSIPIKEGDQVRQGEMIATIDHQLVEKEIQQLEQSLNGYQQKLLQTRLLIQQTQAELDTLQAIASANIASRQHSISQEASVIQTSENILQHLQVDRQAQTQRLNRLSELVEQGAFAEDHLFQVEQSLRERDRTITETQGNIQRSRSAVAQLQAELTETGATAEKQIIEATKQLQQLNIEATDLESRIKETKTLLEQSEAKLNQAMLVAPVSGVVSSLEVSNIGEVMQPGQTVAEIAPSSAPLVLSALLPSQEAGLVEVGMPANIKFDAFPYQDYGIVEGEVLSISPDAKINETTGVVYQVKIELETIEMPHEGRMVALQAGQTAKAEIVIRERRIISLILDPIRKLREGGISL
jgi:hemolysin D